MQQFVELLLLLDRFGVGSADGNRQAGHDLEVVRRPSVFRQFSFYTCIKGLSFCERLLGGEDHLRRCGSEFLTIAFHGLLDRF